MIRPPPKLILTVAIYVIAAIIIALDMFVWRPN